MIAELKPYPEYKDSGLPWLGQVPQHWDTQRFKNVMKVNPSKSESIKQLRENSLVTFLPMDRVGTDGRINAYEQLPASLLWNGFTYFRRGDVLLAKITPCFENGKGACLSSLPTEIGFGSTEFHVLRPKANLSPQFLYLQTCHALFRDLGARSMTGSAGQQRVPTRFVEEYLAIVPPGDEQAAIVRFLDWANGRLNRAIRAKRKTIALLNEQKQAIIHRAVTRGLDPNVRLKPSGVPWIGDIPEHWEVRRAKYLYREVDERSSTGSEELLSVSHLTGVTPRAQKTITMFKAASYVGHKLCQADDLVVNTMWAWMGALGVSTFAGIISPAYAVYRPRRPGSMMGAYIDGLLRSKPYLANIICHSTGLRGSRLRLYPDAFFRLPIIQPPTDEQQSIVLTIQAETAGLDTAISRLEREIELLREYRTRLVADVVTGKLDVREAAAKLPQDIEQEQEEDQVDEDEAMELAEEEVV